MNYADEDGSKILFAYHPELADKIIKLWIEKK
jgi:hypothetical protein